MFPDLTVFWVILFVLLTGSILNRLIVRPVLAVMQDREAAVKSSRELAESAATRAAAATAEFEARTQAARAEIYREMDEKRQQALARRAELLAQTRTEAEAAIQEATTRVRSQAEAARARLEQDADRYAAQIVERVLGRQAS